MTQQPQLARLERLLGELLRVGVALAATALSIGVVTVVVNPGSAIAARLLAAGLVVLMITPMLRVVVSIVEYVRIREWFFVVTTLVVLAELAASVVYALKR
jgi:uncharacterized membrane protein